MKLSRYITYVLMVCMTVSAVLLTSCEQDGDGVYRETPSGAPVIEYIRVNNPAASDSLLVAAELGQEIVIIGSNLGGTRQVLFNDLEADLNPNWVTNKAVFVAVPGTAPVVVTNKIYLVDGNDDTVAYDFEVKIAAPVIDRLKSEWVPEGGELVIEGDYFFEPLTVTFPGNLEGEVTLVEQNIVRVEVPEGATSGAVSVRTNFGTAVSAQLFKDDRGIFGTMEPGDYDGNLWHNASWFSSEDQTPEVPNINGYYIRLNTVASGWLEWFVGNQSQNAGALNTINIATQNIPDGAISNPDKYSLKFEIMTVDTTDARDGWHFFLTTGDMNGLRTASTAGGTRAYEWNYGLIDTGGEWETMSISMSDILKNNNDFGPSPIGYGFSFFFWNFSGDLKVNCAIDNLRIVPNP